MFEGSHNEFRRIIKVGLIHSSFWGYEIYSTFYSSPVSCEFFFYKYKTLRFFRSPLILQWLPFHLDPDSS